MTAAAVSSFAQEPARISSQILEGAYTTGISSNGQWVTGQADVEGYLYIKDLVNNKVYKAGGNLAVDGTGYTAGLGHTISNDGTTIALVNGIPHWWSPATEKWTPLPGEAADGSAIVGSVSPDGSMIIGSIGGSGVTTDDILMTNPCIWYRQDDGSYGDPVFLSKPTKDFMGRVPQYLNLIYISEDCNVMSAMMTDWSGMYQIPYLYIRDQDGNWTYKDVGTGLLNPLGLEYPGEPHDVNLVQPNPYDYLSEAQQDSFWAAFPEWVNRPEVRELSDEDQVIAQLQYMAEFMDDDKKTEYLSKLNPYIEAYRKNKEQWQKVYEFRESLAESGMNFMMNNTCLSPDGKYAYFTAEKTVVFAPELGLEGIRLEYFPVRIDVETGELTKYEASSNLVVTNCSSDYSILCRIMSGDDYMPNPGWIFPAGSLNGMTIPQFVEGFFPKTTYTWMEENMYREVIVGATDNGNPKIDDAFTVGIPYCTPDLDLIVCANSTMYWADSYYEQFNYVSFLISNAPVEDSGVNAVDGIEEVSLEILPDGLIEVKGEIASLSVCDLSGKTVFAISAPAGIVSTGLNKGIYIVRATTLSGESISKKAVL